MLPMTSDGHLFVARTFPEVRNLINFRLIKAGLTKFKRKAKNMKLTC